MRSLTVALSIGLASLSWTQPIMPGSPDFRGFDPMVNGIDQRLGNQLPMDAEFTNEKGEKVKLGSYFKSGKPVIFHPVWFGCEGTCIMTFDGLLKAFIGMKKDHPGGSFEVISFSIKPTETTEQALTRRDAVLSIYNKPGVEAGWHFLTGDLDNIRKLTTALGFRYTWNPDLDKINHPSGVIFATPSGHISDYIINVEYAPKQVVAKLTQSEREKIAAEPAPVINILCFEYNPNTGQTRLIVWRAMQVLGVATVIGLFGAIAFMTIRYRQQPPTRKSGGDPS